MLGAIYVGWRRQPRNALVAYGAGVLVGLIPLLVYDAWAFGSPFHLSYSYVAANSSGVLGLGAPSVKNALRLLVADRGLFVVTPVTAAAIAGIVILWREGRRHDALVPGGGRARSSRTTRVTTCRSAAGFPGRGSSSRSFRSLRSRSRRRTAPRRWRRSRWEWCRLRR